MSIPSRSQTIFFTVLAMIAFAGNSLLCRAALRTTGIDAASFTMIRLSSGALALWFIIAIKGEKIGAAGSWLSALALFVYAAGFSFAYFSLSAATGALLLFGAVQVTMISLAVWRGERLGTQQMAGFLLAFGGLCGLLLPGLSAPPLQGALLMMAAGVAWGIYSLRARGVSHPTRITAGNFLRAVPFALIVTFAVLLLPFHGVATLSLPVRGIAYAIASGAVTSGMGYALWYSALRGLTPTSAATVQLVVPVLAALGGIAFLGEAITSRLVFTSIAILGGIALVVFSARQVK